MILISACLMGMPVRYDGGSKPDETIKELIKSGTEYRLICPECLGGLCIRREPSEIVGGTAADVLEGKARVLTKSGSDVTEQFLQGARAVNEYASKLMPEAIYLKKRSPSCGLGEIYDGSFTGKTIDGNGITAELLIKNTGLSKVFFCNSVKLDAL